MTALELRSQVEELEAERSLALMTGLAEVKSYMADLNEELEICREQYAISAVTEMATLRAELFGPQLG
jgi:hypothetical protein